MRSVEAAGKLVAENEPGVAFFAVADGVLVASKAYPGRRRQIMGFFYPGDLVLPGLPRTAWTTSVRALTAARLEVFPLEAVSGGCRIESDLGYGLFEVACRELSRRWEAAARLRGLSVDGRVAVFLLDVGRRLGTAQGRGLVIPLPMTRAEIASYLGLRTETICRVFSRWNRGGLITLNGPRIVEIQDLADLEILTEDGGTQGAS
jgi:CRP/FNR family transcriptional regulator